MHINNRHQTAQIHNCRSCAAPRAPLHFQMAFLSHFARPKCCVWYMTRATNSLSQNELMKCGLCLINASKITSNFGPAFSHLARCFPKFGAWYEISLRDKVYEPLVQFEPVPGSAAETPKFKAKIRPKSGFPYIYIYMPLGAPAFSRMNFLKRHVCPKITLVRDSRHK